MESAVYSADSAFGDVEIYPSLEEKAARLAFAITVKKGKVYKAGNYKYQITNANTKGKGTVTLTGVKDKNVKKKLKKANVPATVNIGGKSFRVTEIGAGAFSGCRKVASAALGANVAKIGGKAFTP